MDQLLKWEFALIVACGDLLAFRAFLIHLIGDSSLPPSRPIVKKQPILS